MSTDAQNALESAIREQEYQLLAAKLGDMANDPRWRDELKRLFIQMFDLQAVEITADQANAKALRACETVERANNAVTDIEARIRDLEQREEWMRQLAEKIVTVKAEVKTWCDEIFRRLKKVETRRT